LVGWAVIYYAAACGLRASVSAPSTWRAMAAALFGVYAGGLLVSFAVSVGVGALLLSLNALLAEDADSVWGPVLHVLHALASSVACAVAFVALADARMRQAERRALVAVPKDQLLTVFGPKGTARRRRRQRSR
jgi:hypothetical protein